MRTNKDKAMIKSLEKTNKIKKKTQKNPKT